MRTSALFGAKNFVFFKTFGMSAQTRGGGGDKFSRTSFMDGPLSNFITFQLVKEQLL